MSPSAADDPGSEEIHPRPRPDRPPEKRRLRWPTFLRWESAGVLIAVGIALPIVVLLSSIGRDSGGVWSHLAETVLLDYVTNTLILVGGVVSLCLVVGVGCGWVVTLCRFPGQRLFSWALLLPLAIPTYLMAYCYTDLFQFSGPVQTWLRESFDWMRQDYWFPEVRSLPGATVLLSAVLYPYVYLAARTAFLEQSVCVLEVSRTLGLSPWRSFFRVALPLARPSIIAGASLVLMETVAEYGAVDYCAVDTFSTGIYRTLTARGSTVAAAQLSSILFLFVSLVLGLEFLARRGRRHHHATSRYRNLPRWRLRGWRAVLAIGLCLLPITIGFIVPTLSFVLLTLESGDARARELAWTLGKNTAILAVITSILAVLLGFIIALGKRWRPTLPARLSASVAGLGYAIPGTVIAIGVLITLAELENWIGNALHALTGISPGLFLSGTVTAVIFGYLVRFLALSIRITDGGFSRVRPSMDDAARNLGASPITVFFRVHFPLLRGSLVAAALLVFVEVAKELPATLILRPFNFDTLAVRVHQLAADERLDEASTCALVIILVGMLPVFILSRVIGRSRPGEGIDGGDS